MNIFDLLDYLTANLMMPIGGMLIAIFAGWFMRDSTLADELWINTSRLFRTWQFLIRTVTPLVIAGILVTNLIQRTPELGSNLESQARKRQSHHTTLSLAFVVINQQGLIC